MMQFTKATTWAGRRLSLHTMLAFWEVCGIMKNALDKEVEYLDSVLFCFKLTISLEYDTKKFKGKGTSIFVSTHNEVGGI